MFRLLIQEDKQFLGINLGNPKDLLPLVKVKSKLNTTFFMDNKNKDSSKITTSLSKKGKGKDIQKLPDHIVKENLTRGVINLRPYIEEDSKDIRRSLIAKNKLKKNVPVNLQDYSPTKPIPNKVSKNRYINKTLIVMDKANNSSKSKVIINYSTSNYIGSKPGRLRPSASLKKFYKVDPNLKKFPYLIKYINTNIKLYWPPKGTNYREYVRVISQNIYRKYYNKPYFNRILHDNYNKWIMTNPELAIRWKRFWTMYNQVKGNKYLYKQYIQPVSKQHKPLDLRTENKQVDNLSSKDKQVNNLESKDKQTAHSKSKNRRVARLRSKNNQPVNLSSKDNQSVNLGSKDNQPINLRSKNQEVVDLTSFSHKRIREIQSEDKVGRKLRRASLRSTQKVQSRFDKEIIPVIDLTSDNISKPKTNLIKKNISLPVQELNKHDTSNFSALLPKPAKTEVYQYVPLPKKKRPLLSKSAENSTEFNVIKTKKDSYKALEELTGLILPSPESTIEPYMVNMLPEPKRLGGFRILEAWEICSKKFVENSGLPESNFHPLGYPYEGYYCFSNTVQKNEILIIVQNVESFTSTQLDDILKDEHQKANLNNPPKKVRMPPRDLTLLTNAILNDRCYAYPTLVVNGPQPGLNLARIQPSALFPGHFQDLVLTGTLKPVMPCLHLDPAFMSSNQINQSLSWYTNANIENKKVFLQQYPKLEIAYDSLLYNYKIVSDQARWRNVLYFHYLNGNPQSQAEVAQAVRFLWSLDNVWFKLQEDYGKLFFDNYLPYRYKENEWKYLPVSNRLYEKHTYPKKEKKGIPIVRPPWTF